MEMHLEEEQAGFRKDRNTMHQILILRLIAEKQSGKDATSSTASLTFKRHWTPSHMKSFGQHSGHMEWDPE